MITFIQNEQTTEIEMDSLKKLALAQQDYVVKIRRELHRNPETRFNTGFTRGLILNEINTIISANRSHVKFGKPCESRGGITVDIDVSGCSDRILARADFDALPVREETGLDWSSVNEGVSHACGHDAHTAMLLGFLRSLSEGSYKPLHNLRLVFQDGEENPGVPPEKESGGEILVREGVLDGIRSAYSLHIFVGDNDRNGVFLSRSGAMMANSGRICFRIKSTGGHAGMPETGVNALRVAQSVMNCIDSLKSSFMSSSEQAALEPVILNAGKSSNVMPTDAELWYSFRTFLHREEHIEVAEKIIGEVKKTAMSAGAELDAIPMHGAPLLINSSDVYKHVAAVLNENGQTTMEIPPMFGGEDFAHYLNDVPGVMFWLDAYQHGSGRQHTPMFNPDENVFWRGVLYWMLLAAN